MNHLSSDTLRRYADGDDLPADLLWAAEVHLESCAECRSRLAERADRVAPLVDQVWAAVEPAATGVPAPRRRRWAVTWATPAMTPWLGMTVLVTLLTLFADRLTGAAYPSLVLLLAPVAPVAGVAAAWARGLDPAHELVAATPRAGLYLVLRRTVAVLVVVIPPLTVAGWLTGASPVRFLVPCLAFTAATLALGGFVGVRRVAVGLTAGWVALVVAPSLVTARTPVVLEPVALWTWAAVVVAGAGVVWFHGTAFTRLERR